jgi:glycosyltransferase involved in cell wall biosynthesis
VLFGNIPLHGQERSNIQVMTCLQEAGAEILFLTNDEYGHESIQPMLDSLGLNWIEGRFPRLLGRSRSPSELLDRFDRIARYNAAIMGAIRSFRPTHIHVANENHLLAGLPTLFASRIPLVYRLGDKPRDHLGIFRFLWREVYSRRLAKVVCNSRFIAGHLKEVAPAISPSVVYNYPTDRPQDVSDGTIKRFDGTTVLYVGQLSKEKGVGILFESAWELCQTSPSVRFVFVGDYSWRNEFAQNLIARAEAANVSDRLIFPGFVENVGDLYKEADVHVCPSLLEEALPNVIVEAKRAGRPSIVFPSGGCPELIEHGWDGYICASKTQSELVNGLRFYLDGGRDLMDRHGRAAHESLDRLGITREKYIRAWVEVYESCSS